MEQLSVMARERMYAEAANLLQVLLCIAVHSRERMYSEAASLLQARAVLLCTAMY